MLRIIICLAALGLSAGVAIPQEPKKEPPAKCPDRLPWQDDFAELCKELDKVGPRAAKALNKDHEGKPITWKLKFVGFRDHSDKKLELEFDLTAYGIVEPKRAKGLKDKEWKRPVILAFEPHADAVADWKKLETGTEVTVHGTFRKAFWVRLNDTRDFAIVKIGEVSIDKKGKGDK